MSFEEDFEIKVARMREERLAAIKKQVEELKARKMGPWAPVASTKHKFKTRNARKSLKLVPKKSKTA